MEAKSIKKIWANFSVKDARRTHQFYTQLGFKPNGPNNNPQLASFLFGDDSFVIHFFETGSQIDEYLPPDFKAGEVIFTLSVGTEPEVEAWKAKVIAAGGSIFHEIDSTKSNYVGFAFADPDGHRFNVLLM